jgi:thiamine-monophosphate kinase
MPKLPPSEDSILRKIAQSARSSLLDQKRTGRLSLGIGDDAALFRPKPGHETILTCDWFLEGTHFLRAKHPPDAVGWKCLARAVSDVAAMGGTPRCFLLSLALPPSLAGQWLEDFLRGLKRASRKLQCILAGGDTTQRDKILINVTVVSEIRAGQAVLRSGAREGDVVYVSGILGEAELGLKFVLRGRLPVRGNDPYIRKHLYPEPRLELGRWLAEKKIATAMMDLSDGLSSDLARLCTASGVGARIDRESLAAVCVPLIANRKPERSLQLALHGGDDYELLFTASPRKLPNSPWQFKSLPISPVGVITSGSKKVVYNNHGRILPLSPHGWDPFKKEL